MFQRLGDEYLYTFLVYPMRATYTVYLIPDHVIL